MSIERRTGAPLRHQAILNGCHRQPPGRFHRQHFDGRLCTRDESLPAMQAIGEIMVLTDLANKHVERFKSRAMACQTGRQSELQAACSNSPTLFRLLAILLQPVLPALGGRVAAFLTVAPFAGDTVLAAGHAINASRHLLIPVDRKQLAVARVLRELHRPRVGGKRP